MTKKIRVGIAGLGFMGQTHLACFRNSPHSEVVAVSVRRGAANGEPAAVKGNIETGGSLDLDGVRVETSVEALIADSTIDLLDVCLPTPRHAEVAIAALNAGKHVLCEKPMALTVDECDAMIEAARANGKILFVGHCLRFWPQYVAASEMVQRGELGRLLYARFYRAGGAPVWSPWLCDVAQSGGVVLDMHIHDVDTALWWFGEPSKIEARGVVEAGLPLQIDATWHYDDGGPLVHLHGGWDRNRGDFCMSFEVMGEKGSLSWSSDGEDQIKYHQAGRVDKVYAEDAPAYQREIDYLIDCIVSGRHPERVTPESSRLAVQIAREEMRQLEAETGHAPKSEA